MSPVNARTTNGFQPGQLIEALLRAGLGAPPASIRHGSLALPEEIDWTNVCAVAHRCRIAPVLYQCLRATSLSVSADVMNWFRVQYYAAVARNMALLSDLREVLRWFADAAVPALVLKGPALAHLGLGAARVSYDLDIMVHDADVQRVDAILRAHGLKVWLGSPHHNHARYTRSVASGTSVVEVHFDVSDRLRAYRPDLPGLWERSVETTISGVPMRVPDLSDHMLLTIMQLPHHHWAIRLVVDLWQIALRWGRQIDWQGVLDRAGSWQMRILTRSVLDVLWSMFGAPLDPSVTAASSPRGYFERVQWRAAKHALVEQLEQPFRPKLMLTVPFLLVDETKKIPGLVLKRSLGIGGSLEESTMAKAARRNIATVAALPAIGRLLLEGIGGSSLHRGWSPETPRRPEEINR